MRIALLFTGLAALALPAVAQERVIGLLALPQVFGRGACDRFTPQPVPVRSEPRGPVIGSIVVATPWTFEADGGCSGLEVVVRMNGAPDVELPTREYGYEEPGAVVVDAREGWYRVRLGTGSGWVQATGTEFYSLERLYRDEEAYLTDQWNGRIAGAPAAAGRAAPASDSREPAVRVRRVSRVNGALWILVEILNESFCIAAREPKVIATGWVPAHGASGEPTVWFASRGC
jgi:hypothetical protein